MPVLPIPMIVSLVLFALLAHRVVTRKTHWTLLILIAACAVQSAVIAFVQYYGLTSIRPLQPLLATLVPPIAWLAFSQASRGDVKSSDFLLHSAGLVIAIFLFLASPESLDVLIPILFAAYGIAMLLRLSSGEDSLPNSRLESGMQPLLIWRILAMALIASAFSDIFIAYSLSLGKTGVLLWMPSVFSSLTLLGLGALSLSYAIESPHDDEGITREPSQEDIAKNQALVTKLDEYVKKHKPFLDPDLTLTRLSRKFLVPAKQLSIAINTIKGENVSRYINQYRINHACEMMMVGASVTDAMLSSGFNTKSNFNREFLRVKSVSPSAWLDAQQQ